MQHCSRMEGRLPCSRTAVESWLGRCSQHSGSGRCPRGPMSQGVAMRVTCLGLSRWSWEGMLHPPAVPAAAGTGPPALKKERGSEVFVYDSSQMNGW